MGRAISEVLPFAIGVAISPVPIIAVILVLFSARARVNGPVFAIGWAVGVAAVSTIVYLVADAGDVSTSGGAEVDVGHRHAHPCQGGRSRGAVERGEPEEPRAVARRRCEPRPSGRPGW
jgi:hypothetical protein